VGYFVFKLYLIYLVSILYFYQYTDIIFLVIYCLPIVTAKEEIVTYVKVLSKPLSGWNEKMHINPLVQKF